MLCGCFGAAATSPGALLEAGLGRRGFSFFGYSVGRFISFGVCRAHDGRKIAVSVSAKLGWWRGGGDDPRGSGDLILLRHVAMIFSRQMEIWA